MRTLSLLLLSTLALAATPAQDSVTVAVAPFEKDRRWVVVEAKVALKEPLQADDGKGHVFPVDPVGNGLARIFVPFIPANEKLKLTVHAGKASGKPMSIKSDPTGFLSVRSADREITRYHNGAWAQKHKKPFFWPLMAHGVNLLRGWPMEPKDGEPNDHPHHTGLYFCFGEVNGKEYWSKTPITCGEFKGEQGDGYARIVAHNKWGEDLDETQDILILDAGDDVVMDWTITLKAANGPVVFAKDIKMAKEGAFAARVAKELSFAKGDAPDMILDSKGNKGEKLARENGAPWVDYSGEIEGKKVGISIMNHPTSFRYPSDWHVRAYGLFAANPWILKGENSLAKGESLLLKWRVYVHKGNAAEGKVADVFAGYSNAQASAE